MDIPTECMDCGATFLRHSPYATRAIRCQACQKKRDRDWHAQYRAEHYEEIRDRERLNSQRWRAAHPDKTKAYNERYRSAIQGRPTVDYSAILARDGRHCHICDQPIALDEILHFDHVVSLKRGGTHSADNIKVAHGRCNAWKRDRSMAELANAEPITTDLWQLERQEKRREIVREQVRARMAAMTPEERAARGAKISAAKKGVPNPKLQGKPISEKNKRSRAAAMTPEYRARLSQIAKERLAKMRTEDPEGWVERGRRISAAKKGKQTSPQNAHFINTPEVHARALAASLASRRRPTLS